MPYSAQETHDGGVDQTDTIRKTLFPSRAPNARQITDRFPFLSFPSPGLLACKPYPTIATPRPLRLLSFTSVFHQTSQTPHFPLQPRIFLPQPRDLILRLPQPSPHLLYALPFPDSPQDLP